MSRFNSQERTPEYAHAVEALRALPHGWRSRALAEADSEDLKAAFAARLGTPTKGRKSWRRLLGERGGPDDELPADDHVELWVKGNEVTYVSHPYDLTLEKVRAIVQACDEHGLDATFSGVSWYFPGHTLRVEYKKRAGAA